MPRPFNSFHSSIFTVLLCLLRDAPFNLQVGAMVFRRGSDIFFGTDLSPNISLRANRSSDIFFKPSPLSNFFLYPAYLSRGWSRKMADQGRRTQDDRRNRAKLRGPKAIIGGLKPKPISKMPKPGDRMLKLRGQRLKPRC